MCNQNCFTTLFCLLSVRLTAPLLPKDIRQRWLKQNKRKQSKLESRNETDKSIRWCADILRRLGALLAFQSHESLVEGLVAGVHMVMETFHLRMCIVKIKQLNLPIMVKVFEWNAGGLISRIEGLRAFLPKAEMMRRPRNFTDLKNNVGRQIHVCITRTDERTNELIISEKEAWAMAYLREGALLEGTVRKLFPYGAQIRIGETNRGGLLHISKITHGQLRSVSDVLKVGERVKALVIKSTAPDRIALSIKDLESEPGLFLSDKEKVFSEAEEMAQRYRDQISETPRSDGSGSSCNHDAIAFEDEAESYVNWKWLKFIKSDEVNLNPSDTRSGL